MPRLANSPHKLALTEEQKEKIITLRQEGVKLTNIANRFGISTTAVHKILNERSVVKNEKESS